ncbi:alpha/beta hydrolase [Lishizhenia sp.]|uniref:alpha/beta fold hydrolase n=1 Tax=Lishizhenia sp. TaxID=2497594 RepID=UPI00299EFF29|nr:alpha/beta hydrolase [Lishizhenia sp.]MDX1446575.1 alpha/beta hydrolase [Lishizhenia sp.]
MKAIITLTLFTVVFLFTGCNKAEFLNEGDFYYLDHKGAKLPVWIKGNMESDVLLITVHGGPGDSGMEQTIAKGFKYLEDDYAVAHWDQRYSGMSQGYYDKAKHTPEQYIEDTEMVVKLLQQKYPNKKLFMLGHSWGGQLAAGYLGRDNHAANFKGWIDLDGSIYGDLESQLMKEYILDRVPAKLEEENADVAFWQHIVDWYDEHPNPGNYSEGLPYIYVSNLGGDAYNWEEVQADNPTPYIELIFKSMFSFSFYTDAFYDKETMQKWDKLNYTPELENISIPSLILWGADDGIVPVGVADYVYDHLGTPAADKEVVKIPECCHGPQHDQPEIFYQEVSDFIETYKN